MILGLSYIDIIVLVLYFGVIVYIGIKASFKIRNQEDYLLGGRKFGKLTSTFASFGQATSADGPAGVATATFNNGASGIWSSLLMLFITPLFWITSPWLRRLRVMTMGDFYLERYGSKKMAATYAIIASIGMMGLLSVGYLAVTKTALAMTAKPAEVLTIEEKAELDQSVRLKHLESIDLTFLSANEKAELDFLRNTQPRSVFSFLNQNILIWSICLLVMGYTVLGGLEAAVYTDLLQGIFIIILSFILIPFGWSAINDQYGGTGMMQALNHLHDYLPENMFEIFGTPQTVDFTWYFIAAAAVVSGVTVVTQPNQLVTAGAAKDEFSARVGFVTGTFMKRVVTIMWGVLGLSAILLYSNEISSSDLVWGHATRSLLGSLNLGLIGLMLASMMAALMSTADCLMITVSGLVVNNVYHPLVGAVSEKKLIWAGRIAGGIFLIGGATITTQFDDILQVLKFIWEFFVIFAAAFWLGLKWRKANTNGAWMSILGSFSLFYLIPVLIPLLFPNVKYNDMLLQRTDPVPIEKTYEAKKLDVERRKLAIQKWEQQEVEGQKKPKLLMEGEAVKRIYKLPRKSIFWSQGVALDENGLLKGSGYIYLELLFLDAIGFDLAKNPYALNETIRMLIRLMFPFLLLIIGSLLIKEDQGERLDAFYVKMRLPVSTEGKKQDQENINQSLQNPDMTKSTLLFPNSDWEFYKWNKKDWLGFGLSWILVITILGLLYLVVTIGA